MDLGGGIKMKYKRIKLMYDIGYLQYCELVLKYLCFIGLFIGKCIRC